MRFDFRRFLIYISVAGLAWLGTSTHTYGQTARLHLAQRGDSLLLSVPRALLGRAFLLGSRITALSTPHQGTRGDLSVGQRLRAPMVVRWARGEAGAMQLVPQPPQGGKRSQQGRGKAWPTLPIVAEDSSAIVVNFAPFVQSTLAQIDALDHTHRLGRVADSTSRCVAWWQSAEGIEVAVASQVLGATDTSCVTNRKSLRLLAAQPAPTMRDDKRVGYHSTSGRVHRFRLVPSDTAAYARGEVVEPLRPIVFYVDTLFSPLWQSAIKAGIEDWQPALEAAGFARAIVAKSYAEGGADFDADAMGHNTFRYIESRFPNAMGQHWVDPRSGEILEAEVLFYGNVLAALQRWYVLQTGGYNPLARAATLPDSVLHRLIRYAAAHEIGHCLGLEHNNLASFAYDVDSLRSPSFTATHGTTASLMDYARFNYLAQPKDGVTAVYPPLLGAYDRYAIGLSHRYFATADTSHHALIAAAQARPDLRFARLMPTAHTADYACLPTDLGNDPQRALPLALANVQRVGEALAQGVYQSQQPLVTDTDVVEAYFAHLNNALAQVGGIAYAHTPYAQRATAQTSKHALAQILRYALAKRKHWQPIRAHDSAAYDKQLYKLMARINAPSFRQHIEQQAAHTGYTWRHVAQALSKALAKGLPQWRQHSALTHATDSQRKRSKGQR